MPQIHCGFIDDVNAGVSGPNLLIAYGPTIQVDIGFDANFDPNSGNAPIPAITAQHALVDSGATDCCIDSLLASQLKLPIVDRGPVSGVHGSAEVNIHLAQVHIPGLDFTMYGRFAGVHLAAGGQVHRAILGRSFLLHCKMTYDGSTGQVVISK